jgi:hypothetical protein
MNLACWSLGMKKANRRARSVLPPVVVHPFISAEDNGLASGMGARTHMSYTWRAGSRVQ